MVNGKQYIAVEELNEVLENIQKLGPTFQQIADATEKLKAAFAQEGPKTNNLLVELQKAADKSKASLGDL